MNTRNGSLDSIGCPHFIAAAASRGFRPAAELDDDELTRVVSGISERLLAAPAVNGWVSLLGATVCPEYGTSPCCQAAPGGLVLFSDLALLHALLADDPGVTLEMARSAPFWTRNSDSRSVFVFHTVQAPDDPKPSGRLHRKPAA